MSSYASLSGSEAPQLTLFTQTELNGTLRTKLASMPPGRIYYYGDPLETVDLAALCEETGHELVQRSRQAPRSVAETEQRLQQIADRPFDEEQLTVVDGLPQDAAAARAMGVLAGSPEDWLDFHDQVEGSLRGRAASHVTAQEEFFRELSDGQSDLLILVAHSTGSQLYLNGRRTSIKELQELPARTEQSPRPRLAVLVACDAGKVTLESESLLTRWTDAIGLRQALSPVAQILIDKGFVDKVLAPNHKIDAAESLTVLRRVLQGARTQSVFKDWISWAMDWFRVSEYNG